MTSFKYSHGTTRKARLAYADYKTGKGVSPDFRKVGYSPGFKMAKTIGKPDPKIVERQQLVVRLKKVKITLPTVKLPKED